jgi:RHS repeat-associated protein
VLKATWGKVTNTYKGYTITGISLTTPTILSASYYDNYEFMGLNSIPANTDVNFKYNAESGYGTWYGTDYTDANKYKNKDLLTGTLTTQMKSDGSVDPIYLYSVMYYDNRGRLIQTKGNNHLTGGIEKEYIAYNFTGQPTQRKHVHQVTGKNTQTEVYAYTYDHAGRLLKTTHQLTDGTTVKPQVTLAENTHDELGRLKTTTKNNNANLKTTYAYNVRSWTNGIANTHFNEALTYSYNGNISSMQWGQAGKTRKYTFTYDNLSRLKTAAYTGESPTNFAASYTYDKHGNIKTLQRYGKKGAGTNAVDYGLVDDLRAEHTGNQLKYITDAGPDITIGASMDFREYTEGTTVEYTYNANGAMVKDLNKGISAIAYNSLNLPQMVDIKNMNAEGRNEYTYSASGQKLKAVQRWNPNYNTAPVIGSGINVSSLTMSATTDYVGNIIYENNALKRILVDGGYYENGNYYFYINDHLGNNRVVANAAASVVQSTQYYPFGMPFADATGQDVQPYKYNNKELDGRNGLNWYDYSARQMDFALPGFTTPDPHAENYYSWSPYHYAANNPLRFIDPTGMFYDDYFNQQGKYLGTDNDPNSFKVRIIDDNSWVKNSNVDGAIDHQVGVVNSVLHSESGINTNASVKIYQHYNSLGIKLIAGSGNFLMRLEVGSVGNTVLRKRLSVNIAEGYKGKDPVNNNIYDIKNSFIHENKHNTDVEALGVENYQRLASNKVPIDVLEERAINTQVQHSTWEKTSAAYKKRIYDYSVNTGSIIRGLNVNVMNSKSTVPIKIK